MQHVLKVSLCTTLSVHASLIVLADCMTIINGQAESTWQWSKILMYVTMQHELNVSLPRKLRRVHSRPFLSTRLDKLQCNFTYWWDYSSSLRAGQKISWRQKVREIVIILCSIIHLFCYTPLLFCTATVYCILVWQRYLTFTSIAICSVIFWRLHSRWFDITGRP